MFADYGGLSQAAGNARPHSGAGDRFSPSGRPKKAREEAEVEDSGPKISLEEHEHALSEARAAAFQEGRLAAVAEADERMRGVEERYISVLEDIGAQLNESIRSIEQEAVKLALQISEKLVGTIVEINPEYILSIVQEAIKLSGGATIKSVKVSPQDFEFISLLNLPKQFKEFDGTWHFEPDETVKSGCIVNMAGGEVDYQLDAAWERIREHVVKVI
jgi:flagellar biosynthesis/type III secretory pathway protein FliH